VFKEAAIGAESPVIAPFEEHSCSSIKPFLIAVITCEHVNKNAHNISYCYLQMPCTDILRVLTSLRSFAMVTFNPLTCTGLAGMESVRTEQLPAAALGAAVGGVVSGAGVGASVSGTGAEGAAVGGGLAAEGGAVSAAVPAAVGVVVG
jgi:hypothetical protein